MKQQKQSGFAHLMVITVILGLAVVGLLGFVYWQNFVQKKTENTNKASSSKTDTNNETVKKDVNILEFTEKISGVVITYPKTYSVEESAYSQPKTMCSPYFSYIVFSHEDEVPNSKVSFGFASTESIKSKDNMCPDSDIITETDYNSQKQAFAQNKGYAARGYAGSEYTSQYNSVIINPQKININSWYIESYKDSRGIVRRYTTFVDNAQIDAYIPTSYEDGVEKTTDALFTEFSIK